MALVVESRVYLGNLHNDNRCIHLKNYSNDELCILSPWQGTSGTGSVHNTMMYMEIVIVVHNVTRKTELYWLQYVP